MSRAGAPAVPTAAVTTPSLEGPPTPAIAVLRSHATSEAAEAAESFLRYKRDKQEAQVAARQMGLISRSLADREEQRRGLLDAARARATTQFRVFVKPPRLDQPVICLRMRATDTVKDLAAAAESRCGLTLGTTRLAWGGKVVSSSDAVSQYETSSLEPFRLLPAVSTASKSRIHALATPARELKPDPATERPKRVPPPTGAAPSPRLVKLSTPRTVPPMPTTQASEQGTTGTGTRRNRTRPCKSPRLHALAQPACTRQTLTQRAVASIPRQEDIPQPEASDGDGSKAVAAVAALNAASSTACNAVEESAALSFIHEAVALAQALMAEGRRRDLSSEQRHTCYTDAVDSLRQAADVANETQALGTEVLDQLTCMLELAEKHADLSL